MRLSPANSQILLAALNAADREEQTALTQMTTGRRVNQASDDPAAAAMEVSISAQSSDCDQFERSISSVSSELQTADSALNSGITLLNRAITLGVQGANGTMSDQDRAALSNQIQAISQQILGIANLTYNGKYIFAGTANTQAPYVADSSSPGGVAYQGNDSVNQVQVDETQALAVNQPGSSLFSADGSNVFVALSDLASGLQSGTESDIASATTELRAAYDHLNTARVFYGSSIDQLTSDMQFLNSEKLQLSQQMNSTVGVDINVAATNLVSAETSRNAAVQAAAQSNDLSLLDYLPVSGA